MQTERSRKRGEVWLIRWFSYQLIPLLLSSCWWTLTEVSAVFLGEQQWVILQQLTVQGNCSWSICVLLHPRWTAVHSWMGNSRKIDQSLSFSPKTYSTDSSQHSPWGWEQRGNQMMRKSISFAPHVVFVAFFWLSRALWHFLAEASVVGCWKALIIKPSINAGTGHVKQECCAIQRLASYN